MTGDQAFCANCFKCRNCKRKIENLRYARTSQGIFCMDCHEALMARRRKKTAKSGSGKKYDKSLPAIPPPEARLTAYMPSAAELPAEMPAEPMPSKAAEAPSISTTLSELRADVDEDTPQPKAAQNPPSSLTLPSTTYRDHRQSYISQGSNLSGPEEFLIPLAFDPNPPKTTTPPSTASQPKEERPSFSTGRSHTHSGSLSQNASPYVSHTRTPTQDQLRLPSETNQSRSVSGTVSPFQSTDASPSPHISQLARNDSKDGSFKLQEAPKTKRVTSTGSTPRQDAGNLRSPELRESDFRSDDGKTTPRESYEMSPEFADGFSSPPTTYVPAARPLPQRGDSLGTVQKTAPRKDVPPSSMSQPPLTDATNNSAPKPTAADLTKVNGGKVISGPISSPDSQSTYDTPELPQGENAVDKFQQPRSAPVPPSGHTRNESISTLQSDAQKSPALPRYSGGGEFTLEEDISRILGLDEPTTSESFLRRVSNSVRHGRSYSDRSGRFSRDRWPKSPNVPMTAQEISSPSTASPEHREELAWFKNELRRERQKTMEREKKISELEAHINAAGEITQVNVELNEKRSTMVVLDTQKELVVAELEVLTEHIANAKNSGQPLDMSQMKSAVLRDFGDALDKLKRSFTPQIESLVAQKNELLDQITSLTQQKDKSFHEFEQLSNKNAQLAEFNNQLVDQIQNIYKSNSNAGVPEVKQPNGLGIYSHSKDNSKVSLDGRDIRPNLSSRDALNDSGIYESGEVGQIQTLGGAQVVEMKKGAVAKRFDWRKGQKMAKGITKGVKGAFTSAQQNYGRDMQFAETGAYGNPSDYGTPQRGYNGQPPNKNGLYAHSANTSTPSLLSGSNGAPPLFGTELEIRAEYEKQPIPGIVKRCIAEVETRGMDVEGIYRKSGGNSQVTQVKEGFERQPYDYDISDPDLDIHAVTSGLKQYFRKLPTPLITYDVYDTLIELTKIPEGPNQRAERIQGLKDALAGLPRVHYEILEYLMAHLARVVVLEKENLMTPTNVAVVFAPTIMRPESVARELSDTKAKNEIVMWMVSEGERVFEKS